MPSSDPIRAFPYGGSAPKPERERAAIEEFCKAMRRQHGADLRDMTDEAISQALVVGDGNDRTTVDGVLETASGPVAMELLGYAPLEDRGDVLKRDEDLRNRIDEALLAQLEARQFNLHLVYGSEPRRKGKPGERVKAVPSYSDFDRIIEEFRRLLDEVPPLDFLASVQVRFPAGARTLRAPRGILYRDRDAFPLCGKHLTQVRLMGLKGHIRPRIGSDLNAGWIGVDEDWLETEVRTKAQKSLRTSRIRANGLPLWLLVHSDGHATNQKIPEPDRNLAVAACRRVLVGDDHAFDRAYWIDGCAFLDVATVERIL